MSNTNRILHMEKHGDALIFECVSKNSSDLSSITSSLRQMLFMNNNENTNNVHDNRCWYLKQVKRQEEVQAQMRAHSP